jgi:hypothetical protein
MTTFAELPGVSGIRDRQMELTLLNDLWCQPITEP